MAYTFTGPNPDVLANGRPIGRDETVPNADVNLDDPHDAALAAKGWLVEQETAKPKTAETKKHTTHKDEENG